MKSILIYLLLLSIANNSYSQAVESSKPGAPKDTASHSRNRTYVIDINLKNLTPSYGYLQSLTDSTVGIVTTPAPYGTSVDTKIVHYSYINDVQIWRKGSVGRGVLFGALIGAIVGGIAGAVAYSAPPQHPARSGSWLGNYSGPDFGIGVSIAGGGILGAVPGLLIGALAGSTAHHFTINKNAERFNNMRKRLAIIYEIN